MRYFAEKSIKKIEEAIKKREEARKKAVELIKDFKSRFEDVRENAVTELIKIGNPAVIPLLKALDDESVFSKFYADKALTKIGKRGLSGLSSALNKEESFIMMS